jgi:non-heme chloroperoxidase
MAYITVGKENSTSIDLYYEDHGSGRPVVLIHGWPLSLASWEKQVPELLRAGHRVIAYDRRGFGHSSQPTSGYDYDTFAADLDTLLTRLDLRDVALVGFSMGGGEVARYIGKYGSARVSSATLISAVPPFLLKTPDNPSGVDAGVFDSIQAGLLADRPAGLSAFLHDFYNVDVFGGQRVSDDAVRASWAVAIGASPIGTYECVTSWKTDFRQDVRRIDVPTLIVHGEGDRIVPITAGGRRSHELISGSHMLELPGAPHGLNWTHADDLNRELLGFLGARAQRMAA